MTSPTREPRGRRKAAPRSRLRRSETFELHADGHTKVIRETRRLDDVNAAMAEVLGGQARARLAFDMR